MVQKHHVEGYDKFCEFLENFDNNGQTVFLYFSGSKEKNGESWCSDCRTAWPVVESAFNDVPSEWHFVYVEVGNMSTWKNPKCPFRTDPRTRLMVVPTLIKLNTPQRLEGEKLEKLELIQMMFEEED